MFRSDPNPTLKQRVKSVGGFSYDPVSSPDVAEIETSIPAPSKKTIHKSNSKPKKTNKNKSFTQPTPVARVEVTDRITPVHELTQPYQSEENGSCCCFPFFKKKQIPAEGNQELKKPFLQNTR